MKLLLDSTVLVFSSGREHPQRDRCRLLLRAAAMGEVQLHASVDAIQEFTFHRMRVDGRTAAVEQSQRFAAGLVLHAFDSSVLARSIELIATSNIRGRDAVHAATALTHGFTEIVSADTDFDDVPGLTRLDPGDVDLAQS